MLPLLASLAVLVPLAPPRLEDADSRVNFAHEQRQCHLRACPYLHVSARPRAAAVLSSLARSPNPPDDIPPRVADEASTTDLARFILPTLAGWLSSEVMSVVDTAVVGSSSAAELAALGPATMLTDSGAYLFFWLNIATTNLFASNLAQGQPEDAYDVLSDALYVALACGLLLATALSLGGVPALSSICKHTPVLVPAANKYLSIRLLGMPAFIAGMVLQAACLAAKDSTSPLVVLVVAGALNLVLDLWLVNGMGLGIGGAAIATLFSQLVQVALLAVVVQRKRAALGVRSGWALIGKPPPPKRLMTFLAFAGPIFLVLLGKISCYNAMTLAATSGGVVALAAHQVMVSVFFFGCKFGDAVSQTAQAFLPSCMSDEATTASRIGPRAQRLSRRLLKLSTLLGGFISLLAFGFITRCSRVFTTDLAVMQTIVSASPLLFVALVAHATTMCSEGLLLGARQLQYLARAYAFNVALFLTGVYVVARRAATLNMVWCALAIFQYVRLVQFLSRVRTLGMVRTTG
ncbi:hypothetical protein AB1Y20_020201 [Prymnesium parvum]|uniref:Protein DETOXIFICATION n=1 Tax=Prymnesium parvum TaxID=97485 RepID=A0AB34JWJ3_PRYPA